MIDFSARPSWVDWQYERPRSIWKRLSGQTILKTIGISVCSLLFLYLVFGVNWSGKRSGTSPPTYSPPPTNLLPLEHKHPIIDLVTAARLNFSSLLERQPKSLDEIVKRYKERHSIDPPPYFDKWYEFVQKNQVQLPDEYDDIFEGLRPFWGISPALIRRKVATAIATNDYITGVSLRRGRISITERGEEWRRNGIKAAIEPFIYLLPDLDIAFNRHDEPRTIIPYDQLSQLQERANQNYAKHSVKQRTWSARPQNLDSVLENQVNRSPFIECTHPFTWLISTLSCPPDSPARTISFDGTDDYDPEIGKAYTLNPVDLVQNRTAATDVCGQPLLRDLHSFFNSPNTWSITHDPIPIFSPSKPTTFHDILFPAPWYLANMAVYDKALDLPWNEKVTMLYWRGATTSGFSDHGSWHFQNRQRFVESVEYPGKSSIMRKLESGDWTVEEVQRESYRQFFNVHFYLIDNCAGDDCQAQKDYFDVRDKDPYEENWKYKFLLDIDGNAFSGRFYSFLQSNSLVLKQALFKEWHEARIKPWVHYIPVGFNNSDHLELVRFFAEEGQDLAQEIAQKSSDWAKKNLRLEDMQAWVFRLLLEYARLVDDNRDELGFSTENH